MELIVKFLPVFGILALLFVLIKNMWVSKQEVGEANMARIAKNIADGAMSFLKAEYKILSIFVIAVAVLLFFKGSSEEGSNGMVAISFIVGAICSALAGFIGMGKQPETVTKVFESPYNGRVEKVVELFTWEKLDMVPCVSLNFYEKCSDCPDENACSVNKLMLQVRDANLEVYRNNTLQDILVS